MKVKNGSTNQYLLKWRNNYEKDIFNYFIMWCYGFKLDRMW